MLCLQAEKDYKFKLVLLDDREFKFSYKSSQKCEQILIDVAKILNLVEKSYFGFRYLDSDMLSWIDLNKSIHSQFKSIFISESYEIVIYFCVKYYVTDPCKLDHELTRYLYYLQLRKDILQGRLSVQFDFAIDLFSYFLQDELGDYNSKRDAHGYASEFEFMPNQTLELEKAAESKHAKLKGMTQAHAEMNFLNKVKWLDMYGVDLQPVMGENNIEYLIGLTPTGVAVYQTNKVKLNSYFWPRINKVNYKGNKFMLTVIDKANEEKVHIFILNTKDACKNLWKSCVDHHRFFRIKTVYEEPAKINTTRATSKNRNSSKSTSDSSKIYIKRIPAKRIKRRQADYLNGYVDPEQEILGDVNKLNINENILSKNGNLIFNKNDREVNINDVADRDYDKKPSPTMSSKSINSYKDSKAVRRESASESESGHKRKYGRSRSRRSNGNPNNDTDSDNNENKQLVTKSNAENGMRINRSGSNSSKTSRRRHHRSNSRGSYKIASSEIADGQRSHSKSRSRKSLTEKDLNNTKSKSRYDQSETCHETSMDDNDENESERKRQIRRRKRSKSPGGTSKLPEEIRQHINYNLVEASGLSADQLKEIPFVKVETTAPPFRISPHQKRYKSKSPHRRKSGGDRDFYDSKSSVAYIKEGTAQIAKTNKLIDHPEFVMVSDSTTKANTVSSGSAVNSKLNHYLLEPSTNNGFSADSGCEDIIIAN